MAAWINKVAVEVVCSVAHLGLCHPHGLQPARLLCPGKNTGAGSISYSRGSSKPRGQTRVSYIAAGRFFTTSTTWEACGSGE